MVGSNLFSPIQRDLPQVLRDQFILEELTEAQQFGFRGRMNRVEEIAWTIAQWAREGEVEYRDFCDTLELDVYVAFGVPNHKNPESFSAWLIHTSWRSEADNNPLVNLLPLGLQNELTHQVPTSSDELTAKAWLRSQSVLLGRLLEIVYESKSMDSCLAALIAIDVVLCNLLAFTLRVRFFCSRR